MKKGILIGNEMESVLGCACNGCGAKLRRWVRYGAQLRNEGKYVARRCSAYIFLRLLNALTSCAVSLNHSPFRRLSANRLCQYASIPTVSSVSIT